MQLRSRLLGIRGKGDKVSSVQHNGDVFVHILVKPDMQFTRKGGDLHAGHKIDLYTAILGGETTVKTMSGQLTVKIDGEHRMAKPSTLKVKECRYMINLILMETYTSIFKCRFPKN